MDDLKFDGLTKKLAEKKSRRAAFATIFGAAVGVVGLAKAGPALASSDSNGTGNFCEQCCKPGQKNCAKVRFVHTSPDAPAVDIWIGNDKLISNVSFGGASDFIRLVPASTKVSIVPAGQPLKKAVLKLFVKFDAKATYEVAAIGTLATLKVKSYKITTSAIASGNARIRVIHASPGAPAVDIKVKDSATLISNLAFPNASDYLEVPAASYDLQVVANSDQSLVLNLPGVVLNDGVIYDIFAIGADAGSLNVLPLTL